MLNRWTIGIGSVLLAAAIGLFVWHPWSRGSASQQVQPPTAPAAPALVQVQPGLFVAADNNRTFDSGTFKPAEAKNVQVVNVPGRTPFRYVLKTDGLDHQLAPQVYAEGKQGCTWKDGSVLTCSNSYDGYADLYNPNAQAPRATGNGSSRALSETASVCEDSEDNGGIGGECYDPNDEVCEGVSRKALVNASGTCPRQLRCCPDSSAVRDRTEADDEREERAPAKPKAKAKAKGGGDADDVPGDAGEPIKRGRGK